MPELADVFRRYAGAYLEKFGDRLLPSHRRAIQDLLECRTEAMGGHLFRCDHCGHEHYSYHSCSNRSCPKCHRKHTEKWLERRREELLPVRYFHVVFTVPQELRATVRRHQRKLYGILMKAAARALIKLAADPHYVGGLVGVLAVLHTWTRALAYHPHAHCLVPAGGVSADGTQWWPARTTYLVPAKALALIFRGMFKKELLKELPDLDIPDSVWRTKWVVECKPAIQGTEKVLNYLARYVHRIAITNNRILSIDDGKVAFRYKDSRDDRWKTMTLAANEFIRRFLQHVLPKGFHKVRYYGLWNPGKRRQLRQVQLLLASEAPDPPEPPEPQDCPHGGNHAPAGSDLRCPYCGEGILIWVAHVRPRRRAPP